MKLTKLTKISKLKEEIKKAKPAPLRRKKLLADKLGEQNLRIKGEMDNLTEEMLANKKEVMEAAELHGSTEAKQRTIRGKDFIVGYVLRSFTPDVDLERLCKDQPKIRKLITRTVLDPQMLADAIGMGKVKREVITKYLLPAKADSKSIYIRKK